MKDATLNIKRMKVKDLKGWKRNPRKISEAAFAGLKKSIETFGLVEPVIWNKQTNRIVGGHQRVKALVDQGVAETDVVVVDMSKEQEKFLNVTLNNPEIAGVFDESIDGLIRELSGEDEGLLRDLRLDSMDFTPPDIEMPDIDLGDGKIKEKDPMRKYTIFVQEATARDCLSEIKDVLIRYGGVFVK